MKIFSPALEFLFSFSSSFSQITLDSGFATYYPFNRNANIASGNGNHAVFNNEFLYSAFQGGRQFQLTDFEVSISVKQIKVNWNVKNSNEIADFTVERSLTAHADLFPLKILLWVIIFDHTLSLITQQNKIKIIATGSIYSTKPVQKVIPKSKLLRVMVETAYCYKS